MRYQNVCSRVAAAADGGRAARTVAAALAAPAPGVFAAAHAPLGGVPRVVGRRGAAAYGGGSGRSRSRRGAGAGAGVATARTHAG